MKFWAFAQSRKTLRGISVAVMVALVAVAAAPSPGSAEEDNSIFGQKKSRSLFSSSSKQTSNANVGHSPGSGLKATTQTEVLNNDSAAPFITADSVANMQAMEQKYAKIVADGGWPRLPRGNQKKGAKGKYTGILNQRLYVEGYLRVEATQGDFAEVFTSATEEALMRFQKNNGLAVTGKVDGATLLALNVPADKRLATIRANIPRLAEYSKDLGTRYIVVNIPAQQIETVSDGKVYSLHNAIVGRPSRPTPVVMTPITIVRFNPYWNAPPSIVEKDILPRMLSKGPSKIMNEMNMKVFDGVGGPEVDPNKINWRRVRVDDYHFRQEPGGSNAMATAKIEFKSPFGIYLHDTPEPHLFQTGERFYSSGCVRVDKVAILIDWILQGQDGISTARIAELAETKERLDVEVQNAPQLRVAYLTAWPAKDGVASFRADVYQLDGTNFVVGQPLPVGEKIDGQRYVLKPIPRLQEDIDTNDGFGFASLFRSNPDKRDVGVPGQVKKSGDSLFSFSKPKQTTTASKTKEKDKPKSASAKPTRKFVGGLDRGDVAGPGMLSDTKKPDPKAKKTAKKKTDDKTKSASKKTDAKTTKVAKADTKPDDPKAKKVVKTDKAQAAAKKPDTAGAATAAKSDPKAPPAKTTTAKADPKAAPAKTEAPKAAAKPADCKPGQDGKLPAGCKPAASTTKAAPPAAPKKPAAPEGKTASATN